MQPREERHLGRLAEILLPLFDQFRGRGQLRRIGVWQLLENGEMPDGFIQFEVLLRLHRFRADFAEALQVARVFLIDDDRRVPGGFVHDVGRRGVFDVMDLAHVAGDHQHLVGLEFHESRRRNKAVDRDRAPADAAEDVVHFLDARDALEGDAGLEQTLEINFVRVFLQEVSVLPHDETPDRMIDRRVLVEALVDGELQEMFREGGDGRIRQGNAVGVHERKDAGRMQFKV